MKPRILQTLSLLLLVQLAGLTVSSQAEVDPVKKAASLLGLIAAVDVDGEGVFLGQLVKSPAGTVFPAVRLAEPPKIGAPIVWTRDQLQSLIQNSAPEFVPSEWTGAERVRVSRRARVLSESEVREKLTQSLQQKRVGDRGELELRFTRPWTPVSVPDDPAELKIIDLPVNGIIPSIAIRFELVNSRESLGTWQVSLQARIWRDVWTARGQLQRGATLQEDDFVREKRDILVLRDFVQDLPKDLDRYLVSDGLTAGQPLSTRTLRLKPVVKRGQILDAIMVDGAMSISFKAEALEDAIPGQLIRMRNTQTKRELRGKVGNDRLVQVVL